MNRQSQTTNQSKQQGFTLMEIMVASVIFAIVAASLLAIFNYVLKINRKTEALRQASQGMRDLVEFMAKEIRNGQVDYGLLDPGGTEVSALPDPCSTLHSSGYGTQDNRLGLIDTDNQ